MSCRCVICVFPAASVILSLIFTVIYLFALWAVAARLSATVINRCEPVPVPRFTDSKTLNDQPLCATCRAEEALAAGARPHLLEQ